MQSHLILERPRLSCLGSKGGRCAPSLNPLASDSHTATASAASTAVATAITVGDSYCLTHQPTAAHRDVIHRHGDFEFKRVTAPGTVQAWKQRPGPSELGVTDKHPGMPHACFALSPCADAGGGLRREVDGDFECCACCRLASLFRDVVGAGWCDGLLRVAGCGLGCIGG